jgi:hypothetical protein
MRAPALWPMDLSFPGTRRLNLLCPGSAGACGQTSPPFPLSRRCPVQRLSRTRVAGGHRTGVADLCLASAVLEGDCV